MKNYRTVESNSDFLEKSLIGAQDNEPLAKVLKRYREITNEILELISNDGEQSQKLIEALETELSNLKIEIMEALSNK